MTKAKAIIITAMMAIMEAAIVAGAYRIEVKGFYVFMALLALYGFISENADFFRWLRKEEPKEPEHLTTEEADIWAYDDEKEDYAKLFESAEEDGNDGRTEA